MAKLPALMASALRASRNRNQTRWFPGPQWPFSFRGQRFRLAQPGPFCTCLPLFSPLSSNLAATFLSAARSAFSIRLSSSESSAKSSSTYSSTTAQPTSFAASLARASASLPAPLSARAMAAEVVSSRSSTSSQKRYWFSFPFRRNEYGSRLELHANLLAASSWPTAKSSCISATILAICASRRSAPPLPLGPGSDVRVAALSSR